MVSKATLAITMAVAAIAAELSRARDLRPSDHGLEYQTSPPEAPEMEQFFGVPPNFSHPPPTAFPWAMQSNDTSWWRSINHGGGGGGIGGHVSHVLVVVGLVCGAAGACLLVVSGLIYFFKNWNNNNNKKKKNKKKTVGKQTASCFSPASSEEGVITGNNSNK